MALLTMTWGINLAITELSTFYMQSLCCAKHTIHFLLFTFPATDFFMTHLQPALLALSPSMGTVKTAKGSYRWSSPTTHSHQVGDAHSDP